MKALRRNDRHDTDAVDAKLIRVGTLQAALWGRMKEWLLIGTIDRDSQLETDLSAPGYTLDNRVRVKLESKKEMKKRGVDSPDDADALALTFAQTVATTKRASEAPPKPVSCWS